MPAVPQLVRCLHALRFIELSWTAVDMVDLILSWIPSVKHLEDDPMRNI